MDCCISFRERGRWNHIYYSTLFHLNVNTCTHTHTKQSWPSLGDESYLSNGGEKGGTESARSAQEHLIELVTGVVSRRLTKTLLREEWTEMWQGWCDTVCLTSSDVKHKLNAFSFLKNLRTYSASEYYMYMYIHTSIILLHMICIIYHTMSTYMYSMQAQHIYSVHYVQWNHIKMNSQGTIKIFKSVTLTQ